MVLKIMLLLVPSWRKSVECNMLSKIETVVFSLVMVAALVVLVLDVSVWRAL